MIINNTANTVQYNDDSLIISIDDILNTDEPYQETNYIWDKEAGFGDLFDDRLELADFFKEIRRADVDSKYKRMKESEKYYDAQKTEIIK